MWIILLISTLVLVTYYKITKALSYWNDCGVVHIKPLSLIENVGVFVFQQKSFFDYIKDLYKQFDNERYFGAYQFNKPTLYIRDIELIKKITVKDFDHFTDHIVFLSENLDKNLFNLKGQRWRDMRATLSPSFTSSKMKMMFTLLSDCAQEFTRHFETKTESTLTVEMKDAFTRFTNDAIASVAFGLQCNSLEEPTNEFYLMGKEATTIGKIRSFVFTIFRIFPKLAKILNVGFFPTSARKFFSGIIKETINQRQIEGLVRPDMIHLLMEARKGTQIEEDLTAIDAGFASVEETKDHHFDKKIRLELTDDDITAQALLFLFGGFETSATLLTFASYELAINPDIQKRLQNEVDKTLIECNGKLTYEGLHKMKYMDMVVSECLRKWPPGFQLDRLCVADYKIDPLNSSDKSFVIERGTPIMIPVVGIHYDPKYFPNPDEFDPERFSDENKHNIVPFSYLPFGSGPRSCIASRLALMENKTIMFHIISKFDIIKVDKTTIPLRLATGQLNLDAKEGFWLGLKLRKDI